MRVRVAAVTLIAGLLLAGCGGNDKPAPTATATVPPAPTATATIDPNAPVTPQPLTDANSQTISDGVCTALVPDGWVDDGTGRGSTPSGARYVLFGGRIASDADWQRAVELVKSQAGARPGATVQETADGVRVTFADERGFEHRQRVGDRYCDVTVSGSAKIPAAERSYWDAIVASLNPAS